jgi:hypothetical protein
LEYALTQRVPRALGIALQLAMEGLRGEAGLLADAVRENLITAFDALLAALTGTEGLETIFTNLTTLLADLAAVITDGAVPAIDSMYIAFSNVNAAVVALIENLQILLPLLGQVEVPAGLSEFAPSVVTPMSSTTSNVFNFGGNTISDPLTAAAFDARIVSVVRRELKR